MPQKVGGYVAWCSADCHPLLSDKGGGERRVMCGWGRGRGEEYLGGRAPGPGQSHLKIDPSLTTPTPDRAVWEATFSS